MILDADVLIDLKRGYPEALSWLSNLAEIPSVSGIAALEIVYGSQNRSELRDVQEFLNSFPILWPGSEDMVRAMSYADLKLSAGIGILDALTAALAIGQDPPVITFNAKHFRIIPELKTLEPYIRSGYARS